MTKKQQHAIRTCHSIFFAGMLTVAGPLVAAEQQSTWHEHRFRYITQQELDISCGAAAIASLMNRYSGMQIGELQILGLLAKVVDKADQEKVLTQGFSLLNVKQAVGQLGFELKAATVSRDQLVKFGSPAMLQMKTISGLHFVVWHGYLNGYHWLSDPSRGEMWLSDKELAQEHSGITAWLFKKNVPLAPSSALALQEAWRMR